MAPLQLPMVCKDALRLDTCRERVDLAEYHQSCRDFRVAATEGGGQLLHELLYLPPPLTHCPGCGRGVGQAARTFARLCLLKATNPGCHGLQRLNGAVMIRLLGHDVSLCCVNCWLGSVEVAENFARHEKDPLEVPINPGTDSRLSYVGSSLRLLPMATAFGYDPILRAWQVKYGVDSRPFYEISAALTSLVGVKLTSKPVPCLLAAVAACTSVAVTVELSQVGRSQTLPGGDVVAPLFGKLACIFYSSDGRPLRTQALPSSTCLLGHVPHCCKGFSPMIKGKYAYLRRSHEMIANRIVVERSKGVIACRVLCQSPDGRRREFRMEARQDPSFNLLFFVRVPLTQKREDARVRAKKACVEEMAASGPQRKEKPTEYIPLVTWLEWMDAESEQEDVLPKLASAIGLGLGVDASNGHIPEICSIQATRAEKTASYNPRDRKVTRQHFLHHLPDEFECKVQCVGIMVGRAFLVHQGVLEPDAVEKFKCLEDTSQIFADYLRRFLLGAARQALVKAAGMPKRQKAGFKGYQYCTSDLAESTRDGLELFERNGRPLHREVLLDMVGRIPSAKYSSSVILVESSARPRLTCDACCATLDLVAYTNSCGTCCFLGPLRAERVGAGTVYPATIAAVRMLHAGVSSARPAQQLAAFGFYLANEVAGGGYVRSQMGAMLVGRLKVPVTNHSSYTRDLRQAGTLEPLEQRGMCRGVVGPRASPVQRGLEDAFDLKLGKDVKPGATMSIPVGGIIQQRPTISQMDAILQAVASAPEVVSLTSAAGTHRFFVLGICRFRFQQSNLRALMAALRKLIRTLAADLNAPQLCHVCLDIVENLHGQDLVLVCSGGNLLRPFLLRPPTKEDHLAARGDFDAYVLAGVVGLGVISRESMVLRDRASFERQYDPTDSLTVGTIAPELYLHESTLKSENGVVDEGGHASRTPYSVRMAVHGHKPASLQPIRGATSSMDANGYAVVRPNPRGVPCAGSADDAMSSVLKPTTFLNEFNALLHEDNCPESDLAFKGHLRKYWVSIEQIGSVDGRTCSFDMEKELAAARVSQKSPTAPHLPHDYFASLGSNGLPKRRFTFVEAGKALGLIRTRKGVKPVEATKNLWVAVVEIEQQAKGVFLHRFWGLDVTKLESGQKNGHIYQKMVSNEQSRWLDAGQGKATTWASSSAVASRTCPQMMAASILIGLVLAHGLSALTVDGDFLHPSARPVLLALQDPTSIRPSASRYSQLRSAAPGGCVSNSQALICGNDGQCYGRATQLFVNTTLAAQNAQSPSGSVPGINSFGRKKPHFAKIDPLATETHRSKCIDGNVMERGAHFACSACGTMKESGCSCEASMRIVNVSEEFAKACGPISLMGRTVKVEWLEKASDHPKNPNAVLSKERPFANMTDAMAGDWDERPQPDVWIERVQSGYAFGSGCASSVVMEQVKWQLQKSRRCCWESMDRSYGFRLGTNAALSEVRDALAAAADSQAAFRRRLQAAQRPPLEGFSECVEGRVPVLSAGAERGGTLQVQVMSCDKMAAIGAMNYGSEALRVKRAFLLPSSPIPEELSSGLVNRSYSYGPTCVEAKRRQEFERNVLSFPQLAKTLASMPLSPRMQLVEEGVKVRLVLRAGASAADVDSVSTAYVLAEDGSLAFAMDLPLGPNAWKRKWLEEEIVLEVVVFSARPVHSLPLWWKLEEILAIEDRCQRLVLLDTALCAFPAALVGVGVRLVHTATLSDGGAEILTSDANRFLCGKRCFEEGSIVENVRKYCTDCGDCTNFGASLVEPLVDLEDIVTTAAEMFKRAEQTRTRTLSASGSSLKKRRVKNPIVIAKDDGKFCIRCYTDEVDPIYERDLTSGDGLRDPLSLSQWPNLAPLLDAMPKLESDLAERAFLKEVFCPSHGTAAKFEARAAKAARVLCAASEALELTLLEELERLTS